MAASQSAPLDALASLEDRIRRAVDLVTRFRLDKEAAEQERDQAISQAAALRSQLARLTQEIESLRGERETVRGRLERLLEQLDALAAG